MDRRRVSRRKLQLKFKRDPWSDNDMVQAGARIHLKGGRSLQAVEEDGGKMEESLDFSSISPYKLQTVLNKEKRYCLLLNSCFCTIKSFT
jgi:hypothetical protein